MTSRKYKYSVGIAIVAASFALWLLNTVYFLFLSSGEHDKTVYNTLNNMIFTAGMLGFGVILYIAHTIIKNILNTDTMKIPPCNQSIAYIAATSNLKKVHETAHAEDGIHWYLGKRPDEDYYIFIRFQYVSGDWKVIGDYVDSEPIQIAAKLMDKQNDLDE